MLGVIKALTDVGNYIKELKTYFRLKNQTLFTGTWTTGTKTITNISKYQTVKVYTWEGYNGVLLERVSNTRIRGEGMVEGISVDTVHTSVGIDLICDGDQVTLQLSKYMHHAGYSNHRDVGTMGIVKIVGVEPIIPDALAEYIRGGYCVKLGGGLHAKLAKVLERYRQRMAEDFCWHADGKPENRAVIDPVGKYIHDYSSWIKCGKQKNTVSYSVFRSSCSIWTMYVFDQLSRFIQHYSKHYFNKWILDGVQEQLRHKVQFTGSLDCNRQSIVQRGCYHV